MSSGFVSGGTDQEPIQRSDEWLQAQQELEVNRRRKEEEGKQEGGKSLYEILQANKTAKQEAFEESIRLKNQFRNLDEDEVEFLDSVLESTRAKEEAIKKETIEQLDLFRKHREEADRAALLETEKGDETAVTATGEQDQESWTVHGRKRRKKKESEGLRGIKLRKTSSTTGPAAEASSSEKHGKANKPDLKLQEPEPKHTTVLETKVLSKSQTGTDPGGGGKTTPQVADEMPKPLENANSSSPVPKILPGLGLGAYDSDDDD
ncbi:MAG: hypothetical protein M1834_008072 [Cirrosporium novae-zelandiae]|nr:MAG: hypothetical protein M1834_008072 [Cirrosporium novae-zelandiae]